MAKDRIKAKRKCCKERPRCKRCPIVCRRLERQGYLDRTSKRVFVPKGKVPKKAKRAARAA
jgi:hypothetical protein